LSHLWWDWAAFWAYTFAPWGALWLLGNRKQLRESIPAGILFALLAYLLDTLGTQLGLWLYPTQMVPLQSGNMVWNVVGAAPEAMLIVHKDLANPRQTWWWILGIAIANSIAEIFALKTTHLMKYPRWSPWLSIPVYILCFWLAVQFTRYLWRVNQRKNRM
jgi:hypothetical protein